jgi:hypothetical protein
MQIDATNMFLVYNTVTDICSEHRIPIKPEWSCPFVQTQVYDQHSKSWRFMFANYDITDEFIIIYFNVKDIYKISVAAAK